ncbi:SpoIIE family protein phosphatase [Nonomuraea ferruginea]
MVWGDLCDHGYAVCSFRFDEGDLLLLYTDGVTEARDAAGVFYPLADRIGAWTQEAPEGLLKRVCDDLLTYTGGRLGDDAAMIAIRRMPVADSGGAYGPAATSGARVLRPRAGNLVDRQGGGSDSRPPAPTRELR